MDRIEELKKKNEWHPLSEGEVDELFAEIARLRKLVAEDEARLSHAEKEMEGQEAT